VSDLSVTKDIKGAPIWVWASGVAAIVLLYVYLHRASSASSTDTSTAVDSADTTPLDSDLNDFTSSGSSGTTTSTAVSPTTNSEWLSNAEAALQQQGYDPLTIASDLENFINGNNVTSTQQQQIISGAIASQGLPPDLSAGIGSIDYTAVQNQTPPLASTITAPATSGVLGYIRGANGWIGQVLSDGSVYGLTNAEYTALGSPKVTAQLATNYTGTSYSAKQNLLSEVTPSSNSPATATVATK
jgi:hypothetical protein